VKVKVVHGRRDGRFFPRPCGYDVVDVSVSHDGHQNDKESANDLRGRSSNSFHGFDSRRSNDMKVPKWAVVHSAPLLPWWDIGPVVLAHQPAPGRSSHSV
jgi:hypothetical protein